MNRIRKAREAAGLSQKDLAQQLDTSQQAISFYEAGKREPKLETWQKLAAALDESMIYLMGISELPKIGYDGSVDEHEDTRKTTKKLDKIVFNIHVESSSEYDFYQRIAKEGNSKRYNKNEKRVLLIIAAQTSLLSTINQIVQMGGSDDGNWFDKDTQDSVISVIDLAMSHLGEFQKGIPLK